MQANIRADVHRSMKAVGTANATVATSLQVTETEPLKDIYDSIIHGGRKHNDQRRAGGVGAVGGTRGSEAG